MADRPWYDLVGPLLDKASQPLVPDPTFGAPRTIEGDGFTATLTDVQPAYDPDPRARLSPSRPAYDPALAAEMPSLRQDNRGNLERLKDRLLVGGYDLLDRASQPFLGFGQDQYQEPDAPPRDARDFFSRTLPLSTVRTLFNLPFLPINAGAGLAKGAIDTQQAIDVARRRYGAASAAEAGGFQGDAELLRRLADRSHDDATRGLVNTAAQVGGAALGGLPGAVAGMLGGPELGTAAVEGPSAALEELKRRFLTDPASVALQAGAIAHVPAVQKGVRAIGRGAGEAGAFLRENGPAMSQAFQYGLAAPLTGAIPGAAWERMRAAKRGKEVLGTAIRNIDQNQRDFPRPFEAPPAGVPNINNLPKRVRGDVQLPPYLIDPARAGQVATDTSLEGATVMQRDRKPEALARRDQLTLNPPDPLVAAARGREATPTQFIDDLIHAIESDHGINIAGWDGQQTGVDPVLNTWHQGGLGHLFAPGLYGKTGGANRVGGTNATEGRILGTGANEGATARFNLVGMMGPGMEAGNVKAAATYLGYLQAQALSGKAGFTMHQLDRAVRATNAQLAKDARVGTLQAHLQTPGGAAARPRLAEALATVMGDQSTPRSVREARGRDFLRGYVDNLSPGARQRLLDSIPYIDWHDPTAGLADTLTALPQGTFPWRQDFIAVLQAQNPAFLRRSEFLKSQNAFPASVYGSAPGELVGGSHLDPNNPLATTARALGVPTNTGYEQVFSGAASGRLPFGTSLPFEVLREELRLGRGIGPDGRPILGDKPPADFGAAWKSGPWYVPDEAKARTIEKLRIARQELIDAARAGRLDPLVPGAGDGAAGPFGYLQGSQPGAGRFGDGHNASSGRRPGSGGAPVVDPGSAPGDGAGVRPADAGGARRSGDGADAGSDPSGGVILGGGLGGLQSVYERWLESRANKPAETPAPETPPAAPLTREQVAAQQRAQADLRARGAANTTPQTSGKPADLSALKTRLMAGADPLTGQQRLDLEVAPPKTPKGAVDHLSEVLSVPRALMTSYDFSGLGNQGGKLVVTHPTVAIKALPAMLKSAISEHAYDQSRADIVARQVEKYGDREFYKKAGLDLTGLDGSREEAFGNPALAEKIPLVGKGIRGSERAYTTVLNELRAGAFDALYHPAMTQAEMEGIAAWVNVASDRGDFRGPRMKIVQQAMPAAASALFSPRALASRIQFLSGQPLIAAGGPKAQAAIAREYVKYAASVATFIGLAGASGLADVEKDPRSSDFGKVRWKGSHVELDPVGSLRSYIVLAARLVTGQTKNADGEVLPGRDLRGTAHTFLDNKLAPVPAAAANVVFRKDTQGKPASLKSEALKMLAPMGVTEFVKGLVEEGTDPQTASQLALVLGLQSFGVGASYRNRPKEAAMREKAPAGGDAPTSAAALRRQLMGETPAQMRSRLKRELMK